MTFKELRYLWQADLYRHKANASKCFCLRYLLLAPTFKFLFWMRLCTYLAPKRLARPFHWFCRLVLRRYQYKYGISISPRTRIGSGLYIAHGGCIFVSEYATLGRNCNITHEVTIGEAVRGKRKGYPVIGDNVYIGPGAKIIGAVHVGNNAAVGANCVVTKDVPDNAVVVGVPGDVISYAGSTGYISNTDYGPPPE